MILNQMWKRIIWFPLFFVFSGHSVVSEWWSAYCSVLLRKRVLAKNRHKDSMPQLVALTADWWRRLLLSVATITVAFTVAATKTNFCMITLLWSHLFIQMSPDGCGGNKNMERLLHQNLMSTSKHACCYNVTILFFCNCHNSDGLF